MKKYLLIAALLAVIAFGSVVILAQAEPPQAKPAARPVLGMKDEPAAASSPANDSKSAQGAHDFLQDSDACITATVKKEGAAVQDDAHAQSADEHAPSADEQRAFIACMTKKGYTADDVNARLNDDEGGGDDPSAATSDGK